MVLAKNNFSVAVLITLATCVQVCFALSDGIGNPTVPASSIRSGLHRTPNPIDTSSNLVVTGNVAGGKHFRGYVPYRSDSEFGGTLGSSSLNSFMRYSAPLARNSQLSPRPYYNPSSTVSSFNRSGTPSGSGLALPNNIVQSRPTNISIRQESSSLLRSISDNSGLSSVDDYSIARPLSFTPSDLERMVSYSAEKNKRQSELSKALNRAINNEVSQTSEVDTEFAGSLVSQKPFQPTEALERAERIVAGEPEQRPQTEKQKSSFGYTSVYEQMLSDSATDEQVADVEPKKAVGKQDEDAETDPAQQEQLLAETGALESEISEISSETARATTGVHKSFAADSDDKFNHYMRIAEELLASGKYYRACDAYTLASIYKPSDPLAYAGRSHALFASGEYMSSAYFLIKAINIFPGYVNFKVDLNAMIPDRDRLETRVADVKEWIKKTESGELSFLLSYIYYQFGQTDFAIAAADFAEGKMPNTSAVATLRQAIKSEALQN